MNSSNSLSPRTGWLSLSLAVFVISLGGCSRDGKLELQGTVTYQNSPIEKGRIDFLPTEGTGGPSVGSPIVDGRYFVDAKQGVLATGIYRVSVIAYQKTGRKELNQVDRGGPPIEVEENVIPAIYNTQSTLTLRVAEISDTNQVDFRLDKATTNGA